MTVQRAGADDAAGAPDEPAARRAGTRVLLVYAALLAALAMVAAASLALGTASLADAGLRATLLTLRAARLGAALLVGAALAVGGVVVQGLFRNPLAEPSVLGTTVAFVGLLVPHALRPFLGVDHRRLIPIAALGGAVFVASCDLVARLLPARGEVPLGVITGLIGAPAFLVLLARSQREAERG